jgi:hypothetical protein
VRNAEAVFIMCNKRSSSPAEEDSRAIMALLALGQHLQQAYGQGIVEAPGVLGSSSCLQGLAVGVACVQPVGCS